MRNDVNCAETYCMTADDRARGAIFGLAVGDALGAPVETRPRGSFAPITGYRGGGYFRLPPGAWTDDTAMALCLADSLIEVQPFSERDLLDRFFGWVTRAENTSTGICIGAGANTLRTLSALHRSGGTEASRLGARADGNGVLMRLAPVPVRYRLDPQTAQQVALRQGRTTHASRLSEAACAFACDLMLHLLAGEPWDAALDRVRAAVAEPEIEQRVGALGGNNLPPSSGFVLDTLQAALWAVNRANSFSEAVLAAVNLGGDTDTVGAVAGQIAGARWGFSAIPAEWISGLVRSDLVARAADRLVQLSQKSQTAGG